MSRKLSLLVILALTLPGCMKQAIEQAKQSAVNDQTRQQMKEFVVAYHRYNDLHQRVTPSNLEQMETSRGMEGMLSPEVSEAVRSGRFVVVWDAYYEAKVNAFDKCVLVYEKDVPEKGGLAMMGTGEIFQMTPEQFKAAPKWKPRPMEK